MPTSLLDETLDASIRPSLHELRLAGRGLYVVETHDDIYLGTIKLVGEELHVHNGFVGRPVVLHVSEILSFDRAETRLDLVEVQR